MRRPAVFFVALLVVWIGASSLGTAAVRSFRKLSVTERVELQQSEQRMAMLDLALGSLEPALKQKRISRREFTYEERDLTSYIAAEAKYQNDILTKDSGFAEDAREVAQNIAKYATYAVGGILYLAARCAPAGISFSP